MVLNATTSPSCTYEKKYVRATLGKSRERSVFTFVLTQDKKGENSPRRKGEGRKEGSREEGKKVKTGKISE